MTTVNNNYYIVNPNNAKSINIPIEMKWDFIGQDQSIELYEEQILDRAIEKEDFEVLRFAHAEYGTNTQDILKSGFTQLNYKFYFYPSGATEVVSSNPNDWVDSYLTEGFNKEQIYYYSNAFTNSFFKLDFYDTTNSRNQTLYFTVIIPVQSGEKENVVISPWLTNSYTIKKPSFILDYVGYKEGFFLYWLRKKDYIDLNKFYMTAKFFDGRLGVFVKMMNTPQSNLPNKFNFDESLYFYYKVELDYTNKTYKIFNVQNNNRVGVGTSINWYEYVNP